MLMCAGKFEEIITQDAQYTERNGDHNGEEVFLHRRSATPDNPLSGRNGEPAPDGSGVSSAWLLAHRLQAGGWAASFAQDIRPGIHRWPILDRGRSPQLYVVNSCACCPSAPLNVQGKHRVHNGRPPIDADGDDAAGLGARG